MIATLVICSLFISVAFVESRAPLTFVIPSKPYRNINFNSRLNSIGNFFAGVSGVTPSQLLEPSWKPELLRGTSLQDTDLECAYKASRDGWSAVDFHSKVDNRGSCLVVGLTRTGVIFGAFNPLGWMSTDDYGTSNAAFLWFVKGKKVVKCPVLQGGNAAIFDYATGGPTFGAADLVLGSPKAAIMGGFAGPDMMDSSINAGDLRKGSSSLGGAYNIVVGWPVRGQFQLSELEIYCNSNIKARSSPTGGWWPF